MMPPRRGPATQPFWLFPAFVALLMLPAPFGYGVVIAALAGAGMISIVRRAWKRRAMRAAASEPGSVALGTDADGRPVMLAERQLSAHGLILGASGAGKSTTMLTILGHQLERGRPVIAIDMKGSPEFAAQLRAAAVQAGRRFRVWTPDGREHWNPLQHGNATELKDKLIATERFTEPHYQRAAERYVQMALHVLHEARPAQAPTLDDVVALMDPRRMSGMLRHVSRERAARVQDYLADLTPDQLSAIRGLGTRLAIITESHSGRFLAPAASAEAPAPEPPIDLRAALDGSEVVLFSLNSSRYGALAAQLGTLAVQDLVSATGYRLEQAAGAPADGRTRAQAIVGIDEFSALGSDNVISLLARGREAGVSVLLATQELADLDRAAPGLRDQILGVTAVKIAHRQDVPASARIIAELAGTEKVWEPTYQIAPGAFGGYATSRGTRRQVEQFIVHPNEIKRLKTGQAVVTSKLPDARTRTVRVTPPRARPAPDAGRELG